jgi:hypothetical protein
MKKLVNGFDVDLNHSSDQLHRREHGAWPSLNLKICFAVDGEMTSAMYVENSVTITVFTSQRPDLGIDYAILTSSTPHTMTSSSVFMTVSLLLVAARMLCLVGIIVT